MVTSKKPAAPKAGPSKQTANRVVKNTPVNSTNKPARAAARANTLETKMILIWICLLNKGGDFDWAAIARAYGITVPAAQYRYYRVRKYMNQLQLPTGASSDTKESDEDDSGEAPSDDEGHSMDQEDDDFPGADDDGPGHAMAVEL
ncbi:hypothetical protein N7520_011508 [Penicillium odoratum]|uniref:uncharacterized protein n=1 Tax=Penicillium odoratum TaxID=1167516 RepID=UPI002547461A|nr:uncharacterized protein N7520_011508 [Penicillium odoratum]KAJ5746326.1 hypothetical protein N7520_011508 [Penicillium odoratum]